MDERQAVLTEKLEKLLKEAAEVSVTLDRANGTITGVPHYSVIEARAHDLGQQLSSDRWPKSWRKPLPPRNAPNVGRDVSWTSKNGA